MKTLIVFLVLMGRSFAAPFLVCDPYPVQTEAGLSIAAFNISGLSAQSFNVAAQINTDGTQQLHYDLALSPLVNGQQYTISVFAINAYGLGGAAAQLVFTRGIPSTPSNLRIAPN